MLSLDRTFQHLEKAALQLSVQRPQQREIAFPPYRRRRRAGSNSSSPCELHSDRSSIASAP